MSSFETSISRKLPLVSLISAIFIIYTNIAWIPWELSFLSKSEYFGFFAFFTYRFLFFLTFIYLLLRYNLGKLQTSLFTKRGYGRISCFPLSLICFMRRYLSGSHFVLVRRIAWEVS